MARYLLLFLLCHLAFFASGLLAWQSPKGEARKTGQVVEGRVIVDHDHCFRLEAQKGWRVRARAEVTAFNAAMLAGIRQLADDGGEASVLVEHSTKDLDEYTEQLRANLLDVPTRFVETRVLEHQEYPARLLRLTTPMEEVWTPLEYLVVKRGTWFYLMAMHQPRGAKRDDAFFAACQKSLRLLPGTVSPPKKQHRILDRDGVGWRIKDGEFQSIISRVKCKISNAWSSLDDDLLESIGYTAEFGVKLVEKDIHLVLVSDHFRDVDCDVILKRVNQRVARNSGGSIRDECRIYELFGKAREFSVISGGDAEYRAYMCRLGARTYQFLIWGNEFDDAANQEVNDLLSAFESMTEAEVKKLEPGMNSNRVDREAILPRQAFRGGVVWDFERNLRWVQPSWGWWDVFEFNKDKHAKLIVRMIERKRGLNLIAIQSADLKGATAQIASRVVINNGYTPKGKVEAIEVAGIRWFRQVGQMKTELGPMSCASFVCRQGDSVYIVSCQACSLYCDLKSTRISSLLAGLILEEPLREVHLSKTSLEQRRFGFRLDKKSHELAMQATPKDLVEGMSVVTLVRKKDTLNVWASADHAIPKTAAAFVNDLATSYAKDIAGLNLENPSVEEIVFRGRKATNRTWLGSEGRLRIVSFWRGSVFMTVIESLHAKDSPDLLPRFHLLD